MVDIVSIKVIGERTVQEQLDDIADFLPLPKRALSNVAELWKEAIKRRTLDGVDASEATFVSYSPKYAAFRKKTGRTSGRVNLFYKGQMLAAMTHKTSKNLIRIYFRSAREALKAHGHTFGSKNLPQREFFALNSNDLDRALDYIVRNYGP